MPAMNIKIILHDDLSESSKIWFAGLCVERAENHRTCLIGDVVDYSALYGLLERIRDLNLHLESVQVQSIHPKGSTK